MYLKQFILCGLTGWCMEILFTSFGSFMRGDVRLLGQTSIWMFPIYGMAIFIGPIYQRICNIPFIMRGILYAFAIMTVEFATGSILRLFAACPWDYSGSRYNIRGLVRLDYFPVWMLAGLIFERLLAFNMQKG
jgi:uncharacterized membrane protein